MIDRDYPALYEAADTAAIHTQKMFLWTLRIYFVCLIVTAAISAINIVSAKLAVFTGDAVTVNLALTVYLTYVKPQKVWYGTRALAESIKTIAWRFMMRAEPFDSDDSTAKKKFINSLKNIFDTNQKICSEVSVTENLDQISSAMIESRQKSLAERKEIYKNDRIIEQQKWYMNKAAHNRSLCKKSYGWLIVINVFAILLALIKILNPSISYSFIDILVVTTGAIMAWIQVNRYQELAATYKLTAHEIGITLAKLPEIKSEDEFSVFVSDSENAFSREHTQWQARRDAE